MTTEDQDWALNDPNLEIRRLDSQAQLLTAKEHAALKDVGMPDAGTGLEVGCGPGAFAQGLVATHPGMRIIGMDINRSALEQAVRRIRVVQADAASDAWPFPERSFDFAYCRLLLRFLAAPARTLRRMAGQVKPNGPVMAIDGTDASLWLDPVPAGFAEIIAARRTWFARQGGNGDTGASLESLFAQSGIRDVRMRSLTIDAKDVGTNVFAHIVLITFLTAASSVLPDDRIAPATAAVRAWGADPTGHGAITLTVAGGKAP